MWGSRARFTHLRLLLRSSFSSQSQLHSKSVISAPHLDPISQKWSFPFGLSNPRSFSSAVSRDEIGENRFDRSISDENEVGIDQESQSLDFERPEAIKEGGVSSAVFSDGKFDENDDNLSSLWEERVAVDDAGNIFGTEEAAVGEDGQGEVLDIDIEKVEKVRSLLRSTNPTAQLELSLEKLGLDLSEEFVAKVLHEIPASGENLVGFFQWAIKNDKSLTSSRTAELLVRAVGSSCELSKMDAYKLWDLIREIGKKKKAVNTQILNILISIFAKLGKAKAGLEVFNRFDEFGCSPDGDTYYYTIEALGKQSWTDTAWSVCEKMLNTGSLSSDAEKVGKIIAFLCGWRKPKEAHSVYSAGKENKIPVPSSYMDSLIHSLSKKEETVHLALNLLDDYPANSLKYANKPFASVVNGLCQAKDTAEAKKLLMRMVDSGPAPGNAVFNFVITALSQGGDMEEAMALTKIMESRGLRPDIYTYSVIMSGYAKGGLMDEAYAIYSEAKKRHPKLSPVTYHILIRGYCKMEEYAKALECLREMKEDGVKPNADEYNKLIQSLCLKALDWRTAEKLLEEMKEIGLHLKGITQSLIAAVKELEEETVMDEASIEA